MMALRQSSAATLMGRPPLGLQIAMALLALTLLGLSVSFRQSDAQATLHLDLALTTPGNGQLFTPIDGAYRADRVQDVALVADGARRSYDVALVERAPTGKLRFDPGSGPGKIVIHGISIRDTSGLRELGGKSLIQRVALLNDLQRTDSIDDALHLVSTGPDPYFEIALPQPPPVRQLARIATEVLLLAAGVALLVWLLLVHRNIAVAWLRNAAERRHILMALVAALALYAMLDLLGFGCTQGTCSLRGARFGAMLFMAVVGLALVGAASFRLIGFGTATRPSPGFFAASLAGQAVLVAYIYARSLLQATLGFVPITSVELFLIACGSAIYLARSSSPFEATVRARWATGEVGFLLAKLAMLAVLSVVVADRELPRLIMLSSDPDTHAFLARQLERMGGIYRNQADWGVDPLGYPGGSAAAIFIWGSLSVVGIGNALAAMPLMISFLASAAVGETFARRVAGLPARMIVLLTTIGVTCGGFLFPIYSRFAHMEGAGRQISIGAIALLAVCALMNSETVEPRRYAERRFAALATLALFTLATLNPINVLVPGVLIAAYVVLVALTERRLSWWSLTLLLSPLMLAMDPYYWGLMTGRESAATFAIVDDYAPMGGAAILSAWLSGLGTFSNESLRILLAILPEQGSPMFGVLGGAFALACLAAGWTSARPRATTFVVVLSVLGLYAVDVLLQAVAKDSRLYLMPAYYPFSLAQYKLMLLLGMSGALLATARAHGVGLGRLAIIAMWMHVACTLAMRTVQPMHMAPRYDYCGSMGCVQPSDMEVVAGLEELVSSGAIPRIDGKLPRILIPNAEVSAGNERWVFPTGASRYLAMSDSLPVAFYYYQGDSDFTTDNYTRHVCKILDREWLASERIHYVFLPAERAGTCVAGLEEMKTTGTVVLNSGDTYVIRLPHAPGLRAGEAHAPRTRLK